MIITPLNGRRDLLTLVYRGFSQVVQASAENTAFNESEQLSLVPLFLSRCHLNSRIYHTIQQPLLLRLTS